MAWEKLGEKLSGGNKSRQRQLDEKLGGGMIGMKEVGVRGD